MDELKLISTILVVFVHASNLLSYAKIEQSTISYSEFFGVFAALGVPVFFAVSGYLAACQYTQGKAWYISNIKKKTKSLAVPYFIWVIIYCIAEYTIFSSNHDLWMNTIVLDLIGVPFSKAPVYNPLWFVRDLYLVTYLLPILKIFSKHTGLCITFCSFVWYSPLSYQFREIFTWYTVGLLIYNKKDKFEEILGKIHQYRIFIIPFLLFGNVLFCIFSVSQLFYTLIVLWFFVLWSMIEYKKQNDIVFEYLNKYILQASFIIFVLHGKLLSIMQILYCKLFGTHQMILLIGYLGLPCACIIICIFADNFLRRMPRIYNLVTGNRIIS